jgi:cytochrome c peroxidase
LYIIAFLFIIDFMPSKLKLLLYLVVLFTLSCRQKQEIRAEEQDLSELGHYLFFDNRLSYNNTKSCASCHDPKFAFTDGYRRSITASGDRVLHNAPSIINISSYSYFDWANPTVTTLLKQSDRPLFSVTPVELGITGHEEEILNRINKDNLYSDWFTKAFPEKNPVNLYNIKKALEAYVRSIRSASSPYDKYVRGDSTALTTDSRKGMSLFFSDRLKCSSCHGSPLFTNAAITKNPDSIYFNTGLYNITNRGIYPLMDNGVRLLSGRPEDDGKFKTPTLRNVALTAPYTHDGSVNSLDEMINIYQRGGRLIKEGPLQGDGQLNPNKHKNITGFPLSTEEKRQLILFLVSLTDSTILINPKFQNPFH